jgi:6-pyruvoyltetrahydropterin/6-carboxytetrahydropterin synthase
MYYLKKKIIISSAHRLDLPYFSKCGNVHGHNWNIIIHCMSDELDYAGMVIDFSEIKKQVEKLDHTLINDFITQPTAENIAKYLCENIPHCYKVDIEETEGNSVTYAK